MDKVRGEAKFGWAGRREARCARPGGDWPRRVLALNHRSQELRRAFSLVLGLRNEL
nr:MAG TPA: hypothetical protein [Caudoviricetes sp.]